MSGALPSREIEDSVGSLLESWESWLSDYLGLKRVKWKVKFDEDGILAIESPASDLLDLSVEAQLTEEVPEEYADESGQIRTPIFPIGGGMRSEKIPVDGTEGYSQVLARNIVELQELADVSGSPDSVLKELCEQYQAGEIVDSFGTVWSEQDSVLAVEAAQISRSVDEPDVVVSFDVLSSLIHSFQYAEYLRYDEQEDGELVREDFVEYERTIEAEEISEDRLPEVEKVYVHQDRRVAASSYDFSSQQIAEEVQGRVIGYRYSCTVSDPGDREVRAQVGSVVKTVLEDEEESYHGYFRASEDADVSLVYDFYAALQVPGYPYLTSDLAQETSEWDDDHGKFGGWSVADDGFAYHSIDRRREIRRRLFANKYWVIRGENYRRKSEFEEDVEALIELIKSELGCEASWRKFNGTRVSKTPIRQSDILDQIREGIRAPPDQDALIEAVSTFTERSDEVEGVDGPLFPSDLSEFVADTSIIDAQVITRLVTEGDLYQATVIVPDVVLEEIHRQVENDTSRGKRGLEELTALRELAEAEIIDLEIVDSGTGTDSDDNVAVDQALIQTARNQEVPLCSADETLLQFAEAAGVTPYPLEQELSRWSQIITALLRDRGELHIAELVRSVYNQIEETRISEESIQRQIFPRPEESSTDIATEMAIREEVERMERRGELYRQGDQIGLKKEVVIVPSLDAVKNGIVSEQIREESLIESTDFSASQVQFKLLLPDTFEYWASLQDVSGYLSELQNLEELQEDNRLRIEWEDVLPSEAGAVMADEEQFSNLIQGLQREVATDHSHTIGIDTGSGSVMLNY